jgi:hypothetical protein
MPMDVRASQLLHHERTFAPTQYSRRKYYGLNRCQTGSIRFTGRG